MLYTIELFNINRYNKDVMIIFDLDGTLWDSSSSVAESWNYVISEITGKDRGLTGSDVEKVMGLTMDDIADALLHDIEPEMRYEIFRQCEEHENEYLKERGGLLFPGVRETVIELYKAGKNLAIVSNCQKGYINAFLISMGMTEYFRDFEEWGNTGRPKGENIRLVMDRNGVSKAVYVGDIQSDADAASYAGIPFIWAKYGFGNVKKPDAAINSMYELPGTLRELGYL